MEPAGHDDRAALISVGKNRTEPKTIGQWIRYVVVAVIALWLVVWMLRISGINIL